MDRYFCGIDLGTTNLKVLLCDEKGQVAGMRSCPTPRQRQADGVVTDPAEILSAIETLLDEVWAYSGRHAVIAAIATAGVGEDGFLLGADGVARGMSIPWFDRRAAAEAEELACNCDVVDRSGIAFEPTRTAAKWLWLARNRTKEPENNGQWLALTDWPLVAWSGVRVMTEALAARTGCWDVTRHAWIDAALDAAEAPPLPPVRPSGAVIGTLLPDSFPVRLGAADESTVAVCGGHDHPIAAAAIRAVHPTAIVDSLGTAELIYAEAPTDLVRVDGLVRAVPSTANMQSACLNVIELDRYLSDFPAHLIRAELEGKAPESEMSARIWERLTTASMVAAEVLTRMERAGVPQGELFFTGGRARSDKLLQLRADVLGRPVYRVEEGELCSLGAAIIAASGAGVKIAPNLETRRFSPDPAIASKYADDREQRKQEIIILLLHGPR